MNSQWGGARGVLQPSVAHGVTPRVVQILKQLEAVVETHSVLQRGLLLKHPSN